MVNACDTKRYWFRNKKRGIGWVPATWEGWLVLLTYVVTVFVLAIEPYHMGNCLFVTGKYVHLVEKDPVRYIYFFIIFILFMIVVVKKGEKLRPNFISKFFKNRKNEQVKEVGNRKS